jgi:cytochrome c oxidase subunit 3
MSNETFTPAEERQRRIRSRKLVTYLIVFAIVMFFAGLTSAYVVLMNGADYWVHFKLPPAFAYSTACVLAGSITIQLALWHARRGRAMLLPLAFTMAAGIGFSIFQFKGWSDLLVHHGQHFTKAKITEPKGQYGEDFTISYRGVKLEQVQGQYFRPDDFQRMWPMNAEMQEHANMASQFFFALTWAHWGHMAFGLVSLAVMFVMAAKGRYSKEDHVGLWSGTLYWHFLGGLWVYLLLFLLFVH